MLRGCSSAGRAPRSQCGGREFDPPQLHGLVACMMAFCCEAIFVSLGGVHVVWSGLADGGYPVVQCGAGFSCSEIVGWFAVRVFWR